MSLLNAMYTGVSGLDAESDALNVIGNNVANANTTGFKESRAVFEDAVNSAIGSSDPEGAGVQMTSTQQDFTQGTLESTGQPTDLALSGNGFFVVSGSVDGQTGDFYTRNGQTTLNSNGTLVNPDGLALQGYAIQANGQMSSQLGPITLQTAALSPKATDTMTVTANLNSSSAQPTAAWDPQNPASTSNFSTSMTVYDSLGNGHNVSVYFANTGNDTWQYYEIANGSEVQGGTAGQNVQIGSGTLTFNTSGALQSVATTGGTVAFDGAKAQTIDLDVGTPIANGGTGLDGITQFGSPSAVSAQSQDGYASGDLSGVQIGSDGTVSGVYSNGQTIAVGQLAIATFGNNDGLSPTSGTLWAATQQSGEPALGAAGSGGRGTVVSGSLEQSNVDIATQFVDLIAHQRGFEASSKTTSPRS